MLRCLTGARAVAYPDERPHRHDGEHRELDAEQAFLEVGGDFDADVTDPRHHDDPADSDEQHPGARRVVTNTVGVEEVEHILAGDLGEARHDNDVSGEHTPAAHPADSRVEGSRGPREARSAVGVGLVHLLKRDRDEAHGDEREDRDDGGLHADGDDDEAERGGEAVRRCGRGDGDHDARDETEGAGLQALLRCPFGRFYRQRHDAPSVRAPPRRNCTILGHQC